MQTLKTLICCASLLATVWGCGSGDKDTDSTPPVIPGKIEADRPGRVGASGEAADLDDVAPANPGGGTNTPNTQAGAKCTALYNCCISKGGTEAQCSPMKTYGESTCDAAAKQMGCD